MVGRPTPQHLPLSISALTSTLETAAVVEVKHNAPWQFFPFNGWESWLLKITEVESTTDATFVCLHGGWGQYEKALIVNAHEPSFPKEGVRKLYIYIDDVNNVGLRVRNR